MSSRPPYLDPEDISPEVAEFVLAMLNAAETPEEIAAAIEYPGEPDIGVRLAQRILTARDQLGGFTDLRQVRAIRLIGPERFTEIVSALSGMQRPGDAIDQLRAEIAALRGALALGAREPLSLRRLTVQTVQPSAYLGQGVSLVATLMDGNVPAVDVPVTFIATRGGLRASDGYTTHSGHLITARTGVDGVIRVSALPTTTEELSPLQHDALGAALSLLSVNAETPAATASGLQALAQQYAWEINLPLRQAIDIYVREFRPMLLDTVTLRDNMAAWAYHDSAVLAFAPVFGNGNQASSVAATATVHLRVRNWIPAFLEAFVSMRRAQDTLGAELRDLTRDETDTGRLVNNIYAHAAGYIGTRWGNVGAYVGRKVAEASIRSFLDNELQQMPLDTRVAVFPALDIASKTLASTDPPVIRALVGTREDITKDVNRKTGQTSVDLSNLFSQIADLELELSANIENIRLNLNNRVVQLETDLNAAELRLNSTVSRTEFDSALASKADRTALTTFQTDVSRELGTVNTNISNINTQLRG
jgi:hypothetical protein